MEDGEKQTKEYDVAVIGAGPAGMMAASRANQLGARVIVLEKNKRFGKKLLLTGKGRCNLTNAEFNLKRFGSAFGKQGQWLLSGLSTFGVEQTIQFFENLGVKTKVERGQRVFPKSDQAEDILNALIKSLKGVIIKTSAEVRDFKKTGQRIESVVLKNNQEIRAKNYLLATGGQSYPATGSTGDGFVWAKNLGHTVVPLSPALVPLEIKEKWPRQAQGLSLKNVELTILANNLKKEKRFGEMLFTHFGISGPIVLDISKKVGEFLEKGEVKLRLDLKPALDAVKLDKRIQRDFLKYQNKLFKNALNDLLPQKLIPIIIELSGINQDKKVNKITKQERQNLVKLFKGLEMTVKGLLGFESAVITSGGVCLKEIDSRTMKSKIIDNLFLAGEIIDLDGPTGGYNLQLCWTTGYLAGENAAKDN